MNIIERAMPGDSYIPSLKIIADELLSQQSANNKSEAAEALYLICSDITGVDDHSNCADDSFRARLPNGESISPKDAARCVLDYNRTSKFLRGLYASILECRQKFPDTTVEILYAGAVHLRLWLFH